MEFPVLNTPNYFATFLQAKRAGQEDRLTQQRQNAYATAAGDPEAGQKALVASGDVQGAAQVGALAQEQAQRKTLSEYASDPAGARRDALASGDPKVIEAINSMDDRARAEAMQRADVFARVGLKLRQYPYEQRKAVLQRLAPDFEKLHGVPADQVAGFDPTDANLDAVIGSSISVKDQLAEADKAATQAREAAQLDETKRHNHATESVQQGGLGLARQREARIATHGPSAEDALPAGFLLDH